MREAEFLRGGSINIVIQLNFIGHGVTYWFGNPFTSICGCGPNPFPYGIGTGELLCSVHICGGSC